MTVLAGGFSRLGALVFGSSGIKCSWGRRCGLSLSRESRVVAIVHEGRGPMSWAHILLAYPLWLLHSA